MWREDMAPKAPVEPPQSVRMVLQPYNPKHQPDRRGKPALRQTTGGMKLSPEDNKRLHGEGKPLHISELEPYFKGDK